MSAVLFVTDELLLKASHKQLITIPGHVKRGVWIDPYQKMALVSDDHNDEKVASGNGSFYQKQAHKKLLGKIDNYHDIHKFGQAALVLAEATKMQEAASASAAVSGFKASMMAGKVPTPAQYLAMQNASTKLQGDVAEACVAKIGEDAYWKLLVSANEKASKVPQPPKEKTLEPQAKEAQQATPGQPAQAGAALAAPDSAKPTAAGAVPASHEVAKPKVVVTTTPAKHLHTFTGDGLEAYVSAGTGSNKGKFGVSLKDTDSGEFVQSVNFYPTERAAAYAAKAAAGVGEHDDIEASLYKQPAAVTLGDHLADPMITGYSVPEMKAKWLKHNPGKEAEWTAAEVKHNVGDPWVAEKMEEGATKTENGKTYKLFGGKWHRTDKDGWTMTAKRMGMEAKKAGLPADPMSDPDFVSAFGSDMSANNTIGWASDYHKGWDLQFDAEEAAAKSAAPVPVTTWDDVNHKGAVAAMETGAFYQKEAIKKLKAEHGAAWHAMHPSKQYELAQAKYQALQGAASQAAAVSGWKKHMLAGQVPSPSEVKALTALNTSDSAKGDKLMSEVQAVIGLDKYVQLVTQAHAKAGSYTPPPAKVFVTEPPNADVVSSLTPNQIGGLHGWISAGKPTSKHPSSWSNLWKKLSPAMKAAVLSESNGAVTPIPGNVTMEPAHATGAAAVLLSSKPAYDHLAKYVSMGGTEYAKATQLVLAAQDWLAANPTKEAEMHEALAALHIKQSIINKIGMLTKPGEKPAAPAVNMAKDKFKNNLDVIGFIASFKLHGKPQVGNKTIDEIMDPDEIAAFQALSPDQKMDVAAAISFYGPHKLKLFQEWLSEQNIKAVAAVGPVPVIGEVFKNITAGHNKFWSVSVLGNVMKTVYGKIGTKGAETTKEFANPAAAQVAMQHLKQQKLAKDYKFSNTVVHVYEGAAVQATPAAVDPGPKDGDTKPGADGGTLVFKDGRWHKQEVAVAVPNFFVCPKSVWNKRYTDVSLALKAAFDAGGVAAIKKLVVQHDNGSLSVKNGLVAGVGKLGPCSPQSAKKRQVVLHAFVASMLGSGKKAATASQDAVKSFTKVEVLILVKTNTGGGLASNAATEAAFAAAKAGGATGIKLAHQMAVDNGWLNSAKKIKVIAEAMGVSLGIASPSAAPAPAPAAKVFVQPTPKTKAPTMMKVGGVSVGSIDSWQQTGPQKGSNPGGKFKDKNGQEWYCKFPSDKDVSMNEILAAKFYQMLGVGVPTLKLVSQGGKIGIASKWVDGMTKGSAAQLAKAKGSHQAFAIDAWLANWDVVGMSNDNLMLGKDGAAVRVDVGGALVYRAMGGVKGADFGNTVPELETLKDPSKNDKSAAVFSGVTPDSMSWGLRQLNKMKPSQITELCEKLGPGSTSDKAALAAKLIARREFILKKYGIQDQWTVVHKLDPSNLPVNPADLPAAIKFTASSKAHVNAQNTKDSEALIAFAAKGNLTALKEYLYDSVDKETSAPTGKKSILDHPSKPLKEQWAGLVELLQSISTPPIPTLALPSLGSVSDLEEISEFVGSFNPQDRVETVAAEHRMHFFMALSHIDDISSLVSSMKWSFLKSGGNFVQAAKAKHSSLGAVVKKYISSVQSSGAVNHSWSQGKTEVQGIGINKLTEKIYAEAQELPEGTTLIRGMTDTSAGKSMCKQLMSCVPGTVLQNTDSMCASYNESHSWGGDVQMTIRCAKGCKASLSFATGNFGGEHEITTLPGQRYVVLSVKKSSSGTVQLEVLMLPPHDGYVAEVGKLSALGKAMVVVFTRGL